MEGGFIGTHLRSPLRQRGLSRSQAAVRCKRDNNMSRDASSNYAVKGVRHSCCPR